MSDYCIGKIAIIFFEILREENSSHLKTYDLDIKARLPTGRLSN
jgi:hypothetical protein